MSAVKLGVSGVGDAIKALDSGDVKKLDKAMAGLAPNAQAFVKAIGELKPQFDGLKAEVQDNLFAGISDQLKTLVAADLPNLQTGLSGIATALNHNLGQVMTSLGSDASKGLLDRILGNTSQAQERFTAAIDPIIHGLGTLTAAGTDALPRLADGLGKLATRFDTFISNADKDGRLDKWINDGIDGMAHLGNTLLNIGKSFTAVTKAFGGGEGFLSALENGSKTLSDFLNSAEGQEKLTTFFREGKEQLEKWAPILGNIAKIAGNVYDGAKQWSDILLPVLQQISDVLANQPGLIQAVVTGFLSLS